MLLRIFCVVIVVFTLCDVADARPIRLANPSFEKWDGGSPQGWSPEGGQLSRVEGAHAIDGKFAVKVSCKNAWTGLRLGKEVRLQKNTTYAVLVWAHLQKGSAKLQIDGLSPLDRAELIRSDGMKLVIHHFKTPGSGSWARRTNLRFLSMEPDTTMVFDHVRIQRGFVDLASLTSEERQNIARRWTFHPPEYYQKLRRECREHMAAVKAAFDADKDPRYRTLVEESDDSVTLERELYALTFSKATASVSGLVARGETLDGPAIPDLTVVAANGKVYSQSRAEDGFLDVRDEQFNLYLEGEFTPRAQDGSELGATFSVSYDFYKMAGFMTVRYRVASVDEEDVFGGLQKLSKVPPIKRITVYQTLGRSRKPMKYYYRHYGVGADGHYHQAKCHELESEEDAVLLPHKHPYCLWTNGAIGLGVYDTGNTYRQMEDQSEELLPRYLAYEVVGRKRFISVTFRHDKKGKALEKDFEAEFALCVFPIKKFKPTSRVRGGLQYYHLAELSGDVRDAIPVISKKAQAGMNACTTLGCRQESLFPSNAVKGPAKVERYLDATLAWNKMLKDHGVDPIYGAIGHIQWSDELLDAEGFYTPEEMVEVRKMSQGDGQETELGREFLLTVLYNALTNLGFEAIYFDLIGHRLLVSTAYLQEVRLLVDSLGKYFYYHNHMEVSPPMALADYNVPGEQFMVARVEEIPMSYQEIPYNPFLTGVHHRLYNDRSYDLRSPKIWKASLRNALATDVNHYSPEELVKTAGFRMAGRNNPDEITQFEKYGLVNAIFDVSDSEFHHPYDEDYRQFAKVSNPEVTVNLFSRPGECLVTISNGNRERDAVEVSLSRAGLGLEGGHGFVVFDTVSRKAVPAEDRDGWIALPPMTIVEEPRIFVVKTTRDNRPTLLWHDVRVRNCRMVGKDGSHADQYSESGAGVPNRPYLWGGLKRMDLEFESLPGRSIIDVHVGKLGRPQMLLGSVDHISLDSYDRETDIVHVESVFPPSDGLKSGTIWFTFEWDDVTPESEW